MNLAWLYFFFICCSLNTGYLSSVSSNSVTIKNGICGLVAYSSLISSPPPLKKKQLNYWHICMSFNGPESFVHVANIKSDPERAGGSVASLFLSPLKMQRLARKAASCRNMFESLTHFPTSAQLAEEGGGWRRAEGAADGRNPVLPPARPPQSSTISPTLILLVPKRLVSSAESSERHARAESSTST